VKVKIDYSALQASVARDSLFQFVRMFWDVVVPETAVYNWHIEAVCCYLQEAAERVFLGQPLKWDLLINIPPGTTKSTICSVMFPAWCWTRMTTCRIISCSHTFGLAVEMSRKSRMVVESELYQHLFPEVKLSEDQNAKHHYTTTAGGFRYAFGIDGKVTGKHADIIVIDDPLDPEQAVSEKELNRSNRVVGVTLPTRKTNKQVTFTMLVMQRLHQNDPSARMMKDSSEGAVLTPLKHICLPAEIISPEAVKNVKPRRFRKFYKGGLLDPIRMRKEDLDRLRSPRKLGEYGYAGQMLQDPVPAGGGMFKVDNVTVEQPPPLKQFKQVVRYWDKAGTEGGGAFTAGVLMGEDRLDRFWVLDVLRFQHDSGKRESLIERTALLDARLFGVAVPVYEHPERNKGLSQVGVMRSSPQNREARSKLRVGVEQEPGSGGKESAQNTAKRLSRLGFRVQLVRPTGDKVVRADPFSVMLNMHNVFMRPAPWNADYLEELKYFPNSTFKDQVDASSGAFELLCHKVKTAGRSFA
jgi:predicted phage terminase large subunit-like protein